MRAPSKPFSANSMSAPSRIISRVLRELSLETGRAGRSSEPLCCLPDDDCRSATARAPSGRREACVNLISRSIIRRVVYRALRPVLFQLSPDRSHALAHAALRWPAPWQLVGRLGALARGAAALKTRFAGVE